jgi:hypothetical protein
VSNPQPPTDPATNAVYDIAVAAHRYQRRAEAAEAILRDLVDPDDCWFDHHGYCQAHGWLEEGVCPHKRAKDWLG